MVHQGMNCSRNLLQLEPNGSYNTYPSSLAVAESHLANSEIAGLTSTLCAAAGFVNKCAGSPGKDSLHRLTGLGLPRAAITLQRL